MILLLYKIISVINLHYSFLAYFNKKLHYFYLIYLNYFYYIII